MFTTFSDFEVITFFILVAIFDIFERLRPARAIDRFADLRMDVLAFAVALIVNRVAGAIWMKLTDTSSTTPGQIAIRVLDPISPADANASPRLLRDLTFQRMSRL